MLTLSVLGACLAIGSISVILVLLISRIFNHFQILAQEQACLQEYGQAYQEYMDKIPRYFLFF
jgi:protein-S-isoprenylcysteine O-methyltransferase Ste14